MISTRASEEEGFFCCPIFGILFLINNKTMAGKTLIAENKKKLLEEEKHLRAILNKEDIKDGKGEFPGEYKPAFDEVGREDGENATEVENFQNQLSVTHDLEAKLEKVKTALVRMEDGSYGKCSVGGEDIDEDRLRANPSAETCVAHAA